MAQEEQRSDRGGCRLNGVTVLLLKMSRACGAAPVTFERQRSLHIARVSRKYAFIACVIAPLMCVMVLAASILDINSLITKNPLPVHVVARLMARCVDYFLASVVYVVAMFGGSNRMRRFMSCYQRIQKIYYSIENKPMSKSFEKVLSVMLAACVAIVVIPCIANITIGIHTSHHFQRNLLSYIIYKSMYATQIISSLLVLQIIFVVTSAFWTLKCLNRSIARLKPRIQLSGADSGASAAVVATIHRYAATYATIVDICTQITAREGFTMLLLLFDYAFRMLVFAFYVTPGGTDDTNSTAWMYAQRAGNGLNFLRVGVLLVMLVEPCHRTHGELKRTQVLISQLLCVPPSALDGKSVALVRFYEVTEPCGYIYTPLGTFKFSRSLYTALFGGLTTLIVIITHL